MSLTVVSTPIGNLDDITLRAIETLKTCDLIICEEIRPARILLKKIGVAPDKELHQLNEHSRENDLKPLVDLCRDKKVALISDCGTPGFCDPGSKLVDACSKIGIRIDVNPGASSLTALLAIAGHELKQFHFVGFLPAEKGARKNQMTLLKNFRVPLIIMDTPYRLEATLKELASAGFSERQATLGIDLTGEAHRVERGALQKLSQMTLGKHPFILLIL